MKVVESNGISWELAASSMSCEPIYDSDGRYMASKITIVGYVSDVPELAPRKEQSSSWRDRPSLL